MRRTFPSSRIGALCPPLRRCAASAGRLGPRLTLLARLGSLQSRSYVSTRDPAERKLRRYQPVATLDPARRSSSDALDLSSCARPTIQLPSGKAKLLYYRTRGLLADNRQSLVRFPADAVGFLYFHAHTGSLRFRIVPSRLPEDFDAGRDLLLPNGVDTWCIRASTLARRSVVAPLRQHILQDGLVMASELQARACTITTLDRREISDRDLLDLSVGAHIVRARMIRPDGAVIRLFISYGDSSDRTHTLDGIRGFLYYHAAPNPYDDAIRLRLANSVAEFDAAPDLREPVLDAPWGIPLAKIATTPTRRALLDYLVQENLANEVVVRHLQMKRSISRLHNVFFVNFLSRNTQIELCGDDGARARIRLEPPFRDADYKRPTYEGAALARLVILAATDTTISVGIRIEKLLHGPRLLPHVDADGRGGSMPSEGKEVARYRTGVPVTTRVKKDSVAGRIILQMMAQKDAEERALEAR
ncbi:hypothetical protein K523DRAFT_313182 [Schizophyllum commune Tattone D]|nr:hypothetical protein K523DRAFT_313182 [Schizophyllum commune Tattone D]